MITARYELNPYIKQIAFRLKKVNNNNKMESICGKKVVAWFKVLTGIFVNDSAQNHNVSQDNTLQNET